MKFEVVSTTNNRSVECGRSIIQLLLERHARLPLLERLRLPRDAFCARPALPHSCPRVRFLSRWSLPAPAAAAIGGGALKTTIAPP